MISFRHPLKLECRIGQSEERSKAHFPQRQWPAVIVDPFNGVSTFGTRMAGTLSLGRPQGGEQVALGGLGLPSVISRLSCCQ